MTMILDAFMFKFNELIVQMVQDEVGMLLGVPGEIEKLEQTVGDIRCVIADAEKRQTESMAIKRWLTELKDVMYDADEIIDLCQIKTQERLDHSDSPSPSKIGCGFLHWLSCFRNPQFAHEIGTKIKGINSRLEGIAKRKVDLGLIQIQTIVGPPVFKVDPVISHKTDQLVVMKDIVGEKIEEDTALLVSWLTAEENFSVRGNIGVVAIVGMGGIGKTTLAKRIFNDSKIEEFELKVWVCVSKEVKGVELLKCIIRSAGGDPGAAQERSELVIILERVIKGKKFFLVLDDLWPESVAIWDGLLRAPMNCADHGSRLLVTTRDERVVNAIKATKTHCVEKMSDEDGWSLLIKQVFENEEESEIHEFNDIGLKLVQKCDGLPLAIKNIGGVLCRRRKTIEEWQTVLKSNAWSMHKLPNDIHQAFYLSYEDLLPPLKQCFIFCSLYPEDHEFHLTDLIYLWCAEGFLQDNENLWELGNEYHKELLLRNLLEKTEDLYDLTQSKMHDLLWTFARYLGRDENFILKQGENLYRQGCLPKLRRLSLEQKEMKPQLFEQVKWLRTLLIDDIPQNALVDLCTMLHSLRILDLSFSNITTLPDSVGDLVHLRYLSACGSKIRNIPNSIGHLRNLICLNVRNCNELQYVPSSIINLKQLRHLCLVGTKVGGLPADLRNLKKLFQLCGFEQSKNDLEGFSSLDELETLSHLITLWLKGLEKVTDKNIAKRAKLHYKYKLKVLTLEWTYLSWKDQVSQTNEKKAITEGILNELCPPSSICSLLIIGYFGNCLPNWFNLGTSFPNIRYIELESFNCVENLPPLGLLPNLNFLNIRDAYSILTVGEEFLWGDVKIRDTMANCCCAIPAFPKLKELRFKEMPNWKEWQWNEGQQAMPKLEKLFVENCRELRSLPRGLLNNATSLEYLEISGADNLTTVQNFPSIKDLRVSQNPKLERISNLPRVSHILIQNCSHLKILETLNVLQTMKLVGFEMEVLPEYLLTIKLHKLRIDCKKTLLQKITSQRESGAEWQKFKHIPKVTFYSLEDESLYATYHKDTIQLHHNH